MHHILIHGTDGFKSPATMWLTMPTPGIEPGSPASNHQHQTSVPEEIGLGSPVNSMFVGSSNELGAFESGLAAKLIGPVAAVVFGGTMTLITVFAIGVKNPVLRDLDLTEDVQEANKEE